MINTEKNIFNIKFLHFLKLRVSLTKCAKKKKKINSCSLAVVKGNMSQD